MVRSALVGALVMVLVVACARPNNTVQQGLPTPTPTPTPSPSPTPTAPLQASSAPFHVGEVGLGYGAVALSATGGVQPYTWSISAGALPGGLTLGSDGSVSGTPSSAGNFTFAIQVADSGGSTATVAGKIGVAAHLSAGLIAACATQCSVEIGCVNVCGGFGQQSGGVGPYSYALTSGQVPAGTALSGLSLTGTFKGLSGYVKFSVQITDSLGVVASVAPTFWMYQHISLVGGRCAYGVAPCKISLQYSGGTPNVPASMNVDAWAGGSCYAAAVFICPQPPISASVAGGVVSVTIDQYPPNSGYRNPQGTFTLSLTAQDPCSAGARCRSAGVALTVVYTG
jgi:hypothetical protein